MHDRTPLPPFEIQETDGQRRSIPYQSYWGDTHQNFILHNILQIPNDWTDADFIALELKIGNSGDAFGIHPEALIYVDDKPRFAMDQKHTRVCLPTDLKDHHPHILRLEGWTGLGAAYPEKPYQPLYMASASIIRIDTSTQAFAVLLRNTFETAVQLPDGSPHQVALLDALEVALLRVDTRHPIGRTFYETVPKAFNQLQTAIKTLSSSSVATIYAAGHAHIDTAWLWTLADTRGKVARTFRNVLANMEQYPTYVFSQSQPQLYEFAQEDHPALFQQIQHRVSEGRWEALGAMWVESDCNITGAESLVRQFLFGRRYLQEHFGIEHESPILWLPDTFGFPATLPQVTAEAGIPYFFTTKLRWNEHNDFPYDSFWWQGLDGTAILAHITPTPMQDWLRLATYNAQANAQSLAETWERMKEKSRQSIALMAYGWGDGGGGPDETMLQNLEVLPDMPGIPNVKQAKAIDFFTHLDETFGDNLPSWHGELYLETHQGTLTTQAWIKQANRKAEVLLHDAEYLAAWASVVVPGYAYPHEALNAAWQLLLLNQFHDILPGSSIREVYDDARSQFDTLMTQATEVRDTALSALFPMPGNHWIAINTTSVARPASVEIPKDGEQLTYNDQSLLTGPQLSPFEVRHLTQAPNSSDSVLIAEPTRLENIQVQAIFNTDGNLTSFKQLGKDAWSPLQETQQSNVLQLFEDRPLRFDAWNIDPDYDRKMWTTEPASVIEVVENGPIRATLKVVRQAMSSTITQFISLYHDRPTLYFRTEVDWQERKTLLKVAFPLGFHVTEATYHIQWGQVSRPTPGNTSWDRAKYEVAAHYGAFVTDGVNRLYLMSDSKYGYETRNNTMRMTLLRSPMYPDPDADRGQHSLTYALHIGTAQDSVKPMYDLNVPVVTVQINDNPLPKPLIESITGNVVIETIKRSEDNEAIILRLYEPDGQPVELSLQFTDTVQGAWRSNIMEETVHPLDVEQDRRLNIPVKPHQMMTIRVTLEPRT